jgi:hypothetical protein
VVVPFLGEAGTEFRSGGAILAVMSIQSMWLKLKAGREVEDLGL